jgi:hypothetical protein
MDARELIKQNKRKSVFVALSNTRLTGCTITNCVQTGTNCKLQFKSYAEKLDYERGKSSCCGCVTISGEE